MLLLVFMYVNEKDQTSDPQPSCSATPRPPAVNGGVVCSPKVEATVALNHAQLLCVFFFFCPFLPPFVCVPTLPIPSPEIPPPPPPPSPPPRGVLRDMHAEIISSIKNLQLDGEDPRKLLQTWGRLRFPRHVLQ